MRMGSTWANPNAGNQNYLNALYQSAPAQVMATSAPAPAPVGPQVRVKPETPPPMAAQPAITQKPRMGGTGMSRPVGQNQGTMAPGGNQSAFGNPAMKMFKKGGFVTTRKVSTADKNKSQPKW